MTLNKNKQSTIPEAFMLALQCELEKHTDGIGEYELMQAMKLQGYFDFLSLPALPHELFRAHFFLFHSLYLLRNIFLEQKQYLLTIHTLTIQLLPYHKGENGLQEEDKLTAYYLDFNNLENTSKEDVDDLLASFWNNFNRFDNRESALSELGLTDPVEDKAIKETYRRLVMIHHPDRGGDKDKLQKINDAIKTLLG